MAVRSSIRQVARLTKSKVTCSPVLPIQASSSVGNYFPSSSGVSGISARHYHRGTEGHHGKDRQLNESFTGLLPRVLSLQNLFQEKGRQTFSDLFLNDVIVTEQLFTGIKLYTDLQNPLLQKYQFNVQDFFVGSKEAFIQIQKAITMMHLMNHDLIKERKENYQLEEIHMGLLEASVSPKLYQIIEKQLREPIHPVSNGFADYVINMNSVKMNSIVIEHVKTKVIETEEDAVAVATDAQSLLQYPVGSVLATVDIVFENDQVYEHCEDRSKPKIKRTIASKWQFQGCISGHVPLNWMIISMNHYIKKSNLVK